MFRSSSLKLGHLSRLRCSSALRNSSGLLTTTAQKGMKLLSDIEHTLEKPKHSQPKMEDFEQQQRSQGALVTVDDHHKDI